MNKFGPTLGCFGCKVVFEDAPRATGHSQSYRDRLTKLLSETEQGKRIFEQAGNRKKRRQEAEEELNNDESNKSRRRHFEE